jgi:hypothetical protein
MVAICTTIFTPRIVFLYTCIFQMKSHRCRTCVAHERTTWNVRVAPSECKDRVKRDTTTLPIDESDPQHFDAKLTSTSSVLRLDCLWCSFLPCQAIKSCRNVRLPYVRDIYTNIVSFLPCFFLDSSLAHSLPCHSFLRSKSLPWRLRVRKAHFTY